ncbi:MAG: hypothetical protein HYY43_01360, partial [Deltaproteobacteria bacterium]|nr:hypothetical protein [Deltaproteobacteria bacterium]
MDYSNSWDAARLADRLKNTGRFDMAVDELSLQIEHDARLFRSGVSETKSLAVGFALAASDSAEFVKEAAQGCHSFWQASAGASMALAKLFGTIPFATGDFAAKVLEAGQYGPKATAAKAIELAADGLITGGLFVAENIGTWFSGELAGKNIYDATYEITETLGTAALLVLGMKSMVGGITKIGRGIAIETSMSSFSSYSVAALSDVVLDGSVILHGFADIGVGDLLMSAVKNEPQWRYGSSIKRFLDQLEEREQTTAAPPKMGRPPRVSLAEIEAALEEYKGNKTAAGEKVGLTPATIKYYVDNYPELARFKKVPRTPRSKKTPIVSDEKLFELLTKNKGNRTLTAEDAGVSPSLVCKRIKNAAPESNLAKFKGVHGGKK